MSPNETLFLESTNKVVKEGNCSAQSFYDLFTNNKNIYFCRHFKQFLCLLHHLGLSRSDGYF